MKAADIATLIYSPAIPRLLQPKFLQAFADGDFEQTSVVVQYFNCASWICKVGAKVGELASFGATHGCYLTDVAIEILGPSTLDFSVVCSDRWPVVRTQVCSARQICGARVWRWRFNAFLRALEDAQAFAKRIASMSPSDETWCAGTMLFHLGTPATLPE